MATAEHGTAGGDSTRLQKQGGHEASPVPAARWLHCPQELLFGASASLTVNCLTVQHCSQCRPCRGCPKCRNPAQNPAQRSHASSSCLLHLPYLHPASAVPPCLLCSQWGPADKTPNTACNVTNLSITCRSDMPRQGHADAHHDPTRRYIDDADELPAAVRPSGHDSRQPQYSWTEQLKTMQRAMHVSQGK